MEKVKSLALTPSFTFEALDMHYPEADDKRKEELKGIRQRLVEEE